MSSIGSTRVSGCWSSWTPARAIEQELQLGRLVVLDVEGFPLERRWSLVNLRARRLAPAARLCRSFLADYAAAQGAG